jgi:hypothetical protein
LRRLTSAMRDNFPLRRELVNALSEASGEDIAGLVAGQAMSPVLPRGIAGTGPVLVGEALMAKFLSPQLWPVLAASSPRLQGEFLSLYGKALKETMGISVPLGKSFAYMTAERSQKSKAPKSYKSGDPEIYEAVP